MKKPSISINWLKINTTPIKDALQLWVSKWIDVYTSHLFNDVTQRLHTFEDLVNDVKNGLHVDVKEGDSETLKTVLAYIHQVRTKQKEIELMFQPLRDTVSLLKKYDRNLDEYEIKLLADAPMNWESIVNLVYHAKEKVNNLQNEEVDKIKVKIANFANELSTFHEDFKNRAPFSYSIMPDIAYESIYNFHNETNEMEERALKLNDLERVFELNVSKHHTIKLIRKNIKSLKEVWDMISVVKHQFDYWKKTLWDNIDTDLLTQKTRSIQKK